MDQHTLEGAISNVQAFTTDKYRKASRAVDGYVSASPWKAIGIAAAIGALFGFLAARRQGTSD